MDRKGKQKYAKICNIQGHAKICKNMKTYAKYAEACKDTKEICKGMQDYAKICKYM